MNAVIRDIDSEHDSTEALKEAKEFFRSFGRSQKDLLELSKRVNADNEQLKVQLTKADGAAGETKREVEAQKQQITAIQAQVESVATQAARQQEILGQFEHDSTTSHNQVVDFIARMQVDLEGIQRVLLMLRGDYDPTAEYDAGDIVQAHSMYWLATREIRPREHPGLSGWVVFAGSRPSGGGGGGGVGSFTLANAKRGYTRPQYYVVDTIAFSATPTVDADNSSGKQKITLAGNITNFSITGGTEGQELTVIFIHDGASTVAFDAAILGTAPSLDATNGARTMVSFDYDGTNWRHAGYVHLG